MSKKRFVESYSQGTFNGYKIIIDSETGVNYLLTLTSYGCGGMTVLVDKEGKPIVTPIDHADQ